MFFRNILSFEHILRNARDNAMASTTTTLYYATDALRNSTPITPRSHATVNLRYRSVDHVENLGRQVGVVLQSALAACGRYVANLVQQFEPRTRVQVVTRAGERLFERTRRRPGSLEVAQHRLEVASVVAYGVVLVRPGFEPGTHLLDLSGDGFLGQHLVRYAW